MDMAQVSFQDMTEAEMRLFVESHPDQVNEKDVSGHTMPRVAIEMNMNPAFISWLVEKGADVKMCNFHGFSMLNVDILLKKGLNPTCCDNSYRCTPLMSHNSYGRVGCVERLLQEPAVIETIDQQNKSGETAFFLACLLYTYYGNSALEVLKMLFRAGADPAIADSKGRTPLQYARGRYPYCDALIALLEHATSTHPRIVLLTKTRHITVAHHALTRATPSFLLPRMPPLPRVEFARHTHTHTHKKAMRKKTKNAWPCCNTCWGSMWTGLLEACWMNSLSS
jgi:hypothetical protein